MPGAHPEPWISCLLLASQIWKWWLCLAELFWWVHWVAAIPSFQEIPMRRLHGLTSYSEKGICVSLWQQRWRAQCRQHGHHPLQGNIRLHRVEVALQSLSKDVCFRYVLGERARLMFHSCPEFTKCSATLSFKASSHLMLCPCLPSYKPSLSVWFCFFSGPENQTQSFVLLMFTLNQIMKHRFQLSKEEVLKSLNFK